MKRLLTLLTVLLCATLSAFAQGDSPYARFGYEGKVLRTPQERQQRMMLVVPNPDTAATVAKVGLDPAQQKYYLFDKQNQIIASDTLAGTTVSRFLSVDPLTDQYTWLTPYQFASNRPIDGIDRDGLEFEPYWASTVPPKIRAYQAKLRKKDPANAERIIQQDNLRAGIIVGGPLVAPLLGVGVVRYAPLLFSWGLTNPNTAQSVAVGILAAIVGYDGNDLPGPEDDFARLGRRGYEKLAERGLSNEELGGVARKAYNQIIGTIDDEIKGLGTLEEKAKKAFDIRNQAKDFARELSGPENAAAAEAMSAGKHGSSKGPTFEYLVEKGRKAGKSADETYQGIIESSKRSNPDVNAKYGSQK